MKRILDAMMGRRAALGRILGGAALTPMVAKATAAGAIQESVTKSLIGASQYGPPMSGDTDPTWLLQKPLRRLYSAKQGAVCARVAFRLGPFDPDIACLESVSYGQRCRMQKTRDDAAKTILDDLREQLGWTE